MRHYTTSKNCLSAMRAAIALVAVVLIGIIHHYIPIEKAVIISAIVIAALAFIAMFIYLPLYLASVKYTVTDSEIIKSSGVILKFNQSIKFSSIQYSTVIKTPMSDITGINILIFYVFGGNMRLPFLTLDDVRDILIISGSSGGDNV